MSAGSPSAEIQQQVLHKVEVSAVQLLLNQEPNQPSQPNPGPAEAEPLQIKEEQLELSVNQEAEELEAKQENGIFLVLQFEPWSKEQSEVNENEFIQNDDEMNHQRALQGITQEIQIQLHRIDHQQHFLKDDFVTNSQILNPEMNYSKDQEETEPREIKEEEPEPRQIKEEEPEPSHIKEEESDPPQLQGKCLESLHITEELDVNKRKGIIISEPHRLDLTLKPVIKLHRIDVCLLRTNKKVDLREPQSSTEQLLTNNRSEALNQDQKRNFEHLRSSPSVKLKLRKQQNKKSYHNMDVDSPSPAKTHCKTGTAPLLID
ncbi:involucrin isoform X2 [Oryzias latipes]|uniref:involucrin isoform X2 n=1 Tax=Oryzias latipes TaxID=8090 RepID=UPI000CE170AE|nr:involucrin isoform X2 [Oryzias latipes]